MSCTAESEVLEGMGVQAVASQLVNGTAGVLWNAVDAYVTSQGSR